MTAGTAWVKFNSAKHCRPGGDDAIATSALGFVKGVVGELEEQIDAIGGFIEGSDANRNGRSVVLLQAEAGIA